MTTTLINTTGNHRKFYTVTVKDKIVELKWGRIGNAPQVKNVKFDHVVFAEDFATDKINEKLWKRGYERLSA